MSPELAAEIRRIAVETGYFKEKSKRKLDNLREKGAVIAVICPEIVSVHYSEIVSCLKSEVESRGGKMLVCMHDFDKEKLLQTVESLGINREGDGIILVSADIGEMNPSLPIVCLGTSKDSRFDTVNSDGSAIMYDIVGYLKVAMGIIRYFTDNGVSVPGDVSVVGINNIPYAAYSQIPLTTVAMHTEDKCSILVSLLFDKIYGDNKVIQHVVVERETVKKIR